MILCVERGCLFISAGKAGTSSIAAALLPHFTLDPEALPFSVQLRMGKHPEIESLFNRDDAKPEKRDLIRGLVAIQSVEGQFEIELQGHETGFQFRTSDLNDLKHLPARTVHRLLGDERWKNLHTFSVVRNPWDWVASNYAFKNKSARVSEMGTREVLWVRDHVSLRQLELPYRTQHAFLRDAEGNVGLDSLLRFERLEEDFKVLAEKLGLNRGLAHLNQNQTRAEQPRDWRRFYSAEAYDLVAELWAEDIAQFGYADSV